MAQKRMTDAELQQFVIDYLAGHITLSQDVPPDLLPMVFMPLGFMDPSMFSEKEMANIGELYGNTRVHTTTGRCVNGFPMFMEAQFMLFEDWAIACRTIKREAAKGTSRVELVK